MKKILKFYIVIIIILSSINVFSSQSFALSQNKFIYEKINNSQIQITGYNGTAIDVVIPNQIDGYTITTIGKQAFQNQTELRTIELPETITTIQEESFANCHKLVSIDLKNNVIEIGDYAFNNCYNLSRIQLSQSLTKIGKGAFYRCRNLTNIELPKTLTTIDSQAFYYCSGLKQVKIPNQVKTIGDYAFSYCQQLKSIQLSNQLTVLEEGLFSYCYHLENIEIPSYIQSIKSQVFYDCQSLQQITIPQYTKIIEKDAFDNCQSLQNIKVHSLNQTFYSDGIALYTHDKKTLIKAPCSINKYTIVNGTQVIDENAFFNCKNLNKVILPDTVQCINQGAFTNCHQLSKLVLPDMLQSIGNYAFNGCQALETLKIPYSVQTIGNECFHNCSQIKLVVYPNSIGYHYAVKEKIDYALIPLQTKVNINQTTLTLHKGKSKQLTASIQTTDPSCSQTLKWSTSQSKVATVNSQGLVTAKNYGKTTITVTASNGKTATCQVIVPYTITYKLNGGTNNKSNPSTYYGKKITLKNPTRKGYMFIGWYSDSKLKKKVTSFSSGNKTLYAKWTKVSVAKAKTPTLTNTKGKKLKITYGATSGAKGYQIQYATNKKFTKAKTKTLTKRSATYTLSKGKTYYVRVRAFKVDSTGVKIYGKWSSVKTKKILK